MKSISNSDRCVDLNFPTEFATEPVILRYVSSSRCQYTLPGKKISRFTSRLLCTLPCFLLHLPRSISFLSHPNQSLGYHHYICTAARHRTPPFFPFFLQVRAVKGSSSSFLIKGGLSRLPWARQFP